MAKPDHPADQNSAVHISVHLHTILQRPTPDGLIDRIEITLPSGSTLADLLAALDFDLDLEQVLLVVNGRMANPSQPLAHGDQVNLMPAISGGNSQLPLYLTETDVRLTLATAEARAPARRGAQTERSGRVAGARLYAGALGIWREDPTPLFEGKPQAIKLELGTEVPKC